MGILIQNLVDDRGILSEDICYCGSGDKYRECCKEKSHDARISASEIQKIRKVIRYSGYAPKKYRELILKLNKKCLLCQQNTVSSHTLSQSWMRKIFNGNFVTIPNSVEGKIVMEKMAMKCASTFGGRCPNHDYSIFKDIDQNIDINSNYHLNLLAYRGISREFRVKENHLRLLYSYLFHWDVSFNGKELYQNVLAHLYSTYWGVRNTLELMTYVYNGIKQKVRSGLRNRVFSLGKISPVLLSSVITPKIPKNWLKKQLNNSLLTIYTDVDGNGYCILSYKNSDIDSSKIYKRIRKSEEEKKLITFLNELVSKNCENIVCSVAREGEVVAEQDNNPNFPYDTPTFEYIKPLTSP